MAMNPVRVTYPVAATGAQTAISIDWRDNATGCSWEVQFNGSATGTCKVQSTLDDINDSSITPDWVDETGNITSDTRGVIAHPVAAIRLNFSVAVATSTVTFKVLVGAQVGDTSGIVPSGGGATSSNVNLTQVGGSSVALGLAARAASLPVVIADINAGEYETVAASQTAQVLGPTGATGDYLAGLLVIPATTSPGLVTVLDNATSIPVFVGGASSVASLVPFFIPIGAYSVSGAWKVTTGANVSVIGIGNFT